MSYNSLQLTARIRLCLNQLLTPLVAPKVQHDRETDNETPSSPASTHSFPLTLSLTYALSRYSKLTIMLYSVAIFSARSLSDAVVYNLTSSSRFMLMFGLIATLSRVFRRTFKSLRFEGNDEFKVAKFEAVEASMLVEQVQASALDRMKGKT